MSRFIGPVNQLGFVVSDAHQSIQDWSLRLGVGPFVVFRAVEFENYQYMGRPAEAPIVDLAFAQSGALQIEIIQQLNDAPSGYRDFMADKREGFQHVCRMFGAAAEFDAAYARLIDSGFQVVQEANAKGGDARFAYFAPVGSVNSPHIEISEGLLPSLLPIWTQLRAISETWDGSKPVRELTDFIPAGGKT